MKRLLIILALAAAPAFAGGNSNSNNSDNSTTTTETSNTNVNTTSAYAKSTVGDISQHQGQIQGQGQGQTQKQVSVSEGSTSTSGGNSFIVNQQDRLQAPAMSIGAASPSAVCAMTAGLGVSAPGVGLSGNASKVNNECELREWSRLLAASGAGTQAARVACMSQVVAKANPIDCDNVKQERPGVAVTEKPAKPTIKNGRS